MKAAFVPTATSAPSVLRHRSATASRCTLAHRRVLQTPPSSQSSSSFIVSSTPLFTTSRRHRHIRSTVPVSCSAQQSPSIPVTPSPAVALAVNVVRTVASLCAILLLQTCVSRALVLAGVSFPVPLASMLLLLTCVTLGRFLGMSAGIDRGVGIVFAPAVAFLSRWLAVFFVPNLVMLPLAPPLPAADLSKIAVFIPVGFLVTLFSTAFVCTLIRSLSSSSSTTTPPPSNSNTSNQPPKQPTPAAPSGPSNALMAALAAACAISLAVCSTTAAVMSPAAKIFLLCSTLLAMCTGQRLPSSLRLILHPLVVCTSLTLVSVKLLSIVCATPFAAALAAYYPSGPALAGAGNMLSYLLGPAVVTFALTVDKHRRLAKARLPEVLLATIFAAAVSLFGTAFAARLLQLEFTSRLLLIPRTVTAPLAIPIAALIGADLRLTASVVGITGLLAANVGRALLSAFKVKDPVVRGIAMGASGHGLGTAAMGEEPEALPFSALAMTLVGVISTLLVAISPVRALLLKVATSEALLQAAML